MVLILLEYMGRILELVRPDTNSGRGWNNQHMVVVQLGCQFSDATCANCQALFNSDANSRMPHVPIAKALFSSDANSRMPVSDARNTLSRTRMLNSDKA